ncbi:MAG: hypothetical protein ABSD74_05375 [Rhizomicrobium sp.]|jgi:hypothetical protein
MTKRDFTGLWRLVPAKSRLPGLAVSKLGMKIEHCEPHFVQAVKTLYADGTMSLGRIEGDTGGQAFSNEVRGLTMVSTAMWEDDELVIDSHVETGGERPLHFRDHWSLSAGGEELRMEHRDDDIAGQLSVLERVGEIA